MDFGSAFSYCFGSGTERREAESMSAAVIAKQSIPLPSGSRYRIGAWVAVAGVLMLFTALASAYIVRSASGNDWIPIAMPRVLWLSTVMIVVSSITLEVSRRSLKRQRDNGYSL